VALQYECRRVKEEIALDKKCKNAEDNCIVVIYFWEQYNSPRCWRTEGKAQEIFDKLNSKTAKVAAVKEQILIRYLGLGWVDAHHV